MTLPTAWDILASRALELRKDSNPRAQVTVQLSSEVRNSKSGFLYPQSWGCSTQSFSPKLSPLAVPSPTLPDLPSFLASKVTYFRKSFFRGSTLSSMPLLRPKQHCIFTV